MCVAKSVVTLFATLVLQRLADGNRAQRARFPVPGVDNASRSLRRGGSTRGLRLPCRTYLWPFFRDNPHLANLLSVLASELIKARTNAKYGLRVGVIAILHTFNGKLEFNSHVHTMATAGGLHGSSCTWVSRVYYDRDALMEAWRKAVIALLRAALRAGQLRTELTASQMEDLVIIWRDAGGASRFNRSKTNRISCNTPVAM